MFKIIKLSEDLSQSWIVEDATVELLPETFETEELARHYITNTIYPKNKDEWAALYSEDDNVETEIDKYDGCEYVIINKLDDELNWYERYKIVKI